MNAKKFIKLFFLSIVLCFLIIEIIFQLNKCQYKNKVDYIVNYKLNKIKNQKFDSLILGDSISEMVLSPTILKNGILDLSTTVPVSLVGNYFIIRRFIKNKNSVKSIYLFSSIELLNETLNRELTYSYFESIFINKNEKNEIMKIRLDLYKNTIFDDYFISRRSTLFFPKCFKNVLKEKPIYINETNLIKKEKFTNRSINDRILKYQKYKLIPELPKVYLNKIIKLCEQNNIKFTLIIEPSLEKANEIFKKSLWKQHLDKMTLKVININSIYQFNNYAFHSDGLHLRGDDNLYYQNIINKYILKIYEEIE